MELIIQFPAHKPNLAHGTRSVIQQMNLEFGLCEMVAETLLGIRVSSALFPWHLLQPLVKEEEKGARAVARMDLTIWS